MTGLANPSSRAEISGAKISEIFGFDRGFRDSTPSAAVCWVGREVHAEASAPTKRELPPGFSAQGHLLHCFAAAMPLVTR
jgi:hypothetical protein